MDSIREQMDLTNEISDAISNPVGMGHDIDEDERELMGRALEENSVIVAQMTPFFEDAKGGSDTLH